LLVILKKLH